MRPDHVQYVELHLEGYDKETDKFVRHVVLSDKVPAGMASDTGMVPITSEVAKRYAAIDDELNRLDWYLCWLDAGD